jgi:Fe2+ transport system protein FeoA
MMGLLNLRTSLKSGLMQVLPLHLLYPGQFGRVCDVSGNSAMVGRLDEMGLREGVQVRMVQSGEPCIVAFEDHRLTFRGEEEVSVFVEVSA